MADAGRYSQRQAEFFIAQQVSLLQFNEAEALSPKQLQAKISELLSGNPDLAEAVSIKCLPRREVNLYVSSMKFSG